MQIPPPLTERNAAELLAKAAELLIMSETARTADTGDALRRLAERFARLAESRSAGTVTGGSRFCQPPRDIAASREP